jgi:flagellar hook assembly protein FlgD
MTTVSNNTSNPALDRMRWEEESIVTNEVNGSLGQEDFFTLLTTQLAM